MKPEVLPVAADPASSITLVPAASSQMQKAAEARSGCRELHPVNKSERCQEKDAELAVVALSYQS
jgi:hypothetical protein